MKLVIPCCILILLMSACDRRSDASIQKILPGNWRLDSTNSKNDFHSNFEVASDYSYKCLITYRYSNILQHVALQGTFQVKEGFLIDTTTKHSNTNAVVPMISKYRVLRADKGELVLESNTTYETNVVTLRKE